LVKLGEIHRRPGWVGVEAPDKEKTVCSPNKGTKKQKTGKKKKKNNGGRECGVAV